jgi:hypothetical protein
MIPSSRLSNRPRPRLEQCPQMEYIAVAGINHLNTTHANVPFLVGTETHSGPGWILVFQYLQRVHFLRRIVLFRSASGAKLNVSHVVQSWVTGICHISDQKSSV